MINNSNNDNNNYITHCLFVLREPEEVADLLAEVVADQVAPLRPDPQLVQ